MSQSQPSIDRTELLAWVERVATFFAAHFGLPPITGRIIGWLMVADPAEQSAGEIAEAIGASRASLTSNMRLLTASGMVHRLTRPGGRTTYYRIDDDMWETLLRRRLVAMMSFGRIAEEGMALIGPGTPRANRLGAAHHFFDWVAGLLANAPGPRNDAQR